MGKADPAEYAALGKRQTTPFGLSQTPRSSLPTSVPLGACSDLTPRPRSQEDWETCGEGNAIRRQVWAENSLESDALLGSKGKQSEWFFNCIRPTILVVSKVCFSPPWKETECQIQVVIGAMWFTYRLIHYSSKWESWFSKMIFIFRLLCSHNPSEFVTLIVLHVLEILLMITLCLK